MSRKIVLFIMSNDTIGNVFGQRFSIKMYKYLFLTILCVEVIKGSHHPDYEEK